MNWRMLWYLAITSLFCLCACGCSGFKPFLLSFVPPEIQDIYESNRRRKRKPNRSIQSTLPCKPANKPTSNHSQAEALGEAEGLFRDFKYAEAVSVCTKAIRHARGLIRAKLLCLRGACYYQQGNLVAAKRDLRAALRLGQSLPLSVYHPEYLKLAE